MTQSADAMLARFWSELSDIRTGLLGLASGEGEAQPMTAHFDGPGAAVWFVARADSPLTAAASGAPAARFHYAGKSHGFFADVAGALTREGDGSVLDRYWTPEVARWFDSKADAAVLRLDLERGKTWVPGEAVDGVDISFGR